MQFTRQDAITFAVGLGAAVLLQVGVALAQTGSQVDDVGAYALSFGTGLASAAGRYIVTYMTQRGLAGD